MPIHPLTNQFHVTEGLKHTEDEDGGAIARKAYKPIPCNRRIETPSFFDSSNSHFHLTNQFHVTEGLKQK